MFFMDSNAVNVFFFPLMLQYHKNKGIEPHEIRNEETFQPQSLT